MNLGLILLLIFTVIVIGGFFLFPKNSTFYLGNIGFTRRKMTRSDELASLNTRDFKSGGSTTLII